MGWVLCFVVGDRSIKFKILSRAGYIISCSANKAQMDVGKRIRHETDTYILVVCTKIQL